MARFEASHRVLASRQSAQIQRRSIRLACRISKVWKASLRKGLHHHLQMPIMKDASARCWPMSRNTQNPYKLWLCHYLRLAFIDRRKTSKLIQTSISDCALTLIYRLLSATSNFFERLRIRFKWFTIRGFRRFRADDWSAFLSWLIGGVGIWIVVGT